MLEMSSAKNFHFSTRYSVLGTFLKNILLLVSIAAYNSFCNQIHVYNCIRNIQLLLFFIITYT